MYPSLAEAKHIAGTDEFRRIPVKREFFADRFTTIEVLRKLKSVSSHVFLFESVEQNRSWSRWSFLGFSPSLELSCSDGTLRIRRRESEDSVVEETKQVDSPNEEIRRILAENRAPRLKGFPPFCGGFVGYFAFEYLKYPEPRLSCLTELDAADDFKDVDLMLFDTVVAFDSYRQKIVLVGSVETDSMEQSYRDAEKRFDSIERLLSQKAGLEFPRLQLEEDLQPMFPCDRFHAMVGKAKEYLREGDIFQVVLSNPMKAKAHGSLLDVYRVLRTTNPSPYMFYFSSDDVEIAGASPETLLKLEDGKLHTYPLAGTRRRGTDEAEDRALEEELLRDEKELAEHNMLVDLGRNDLGRISKIGTVQVEKYLCVERFSHVMHIASTVSSVIRDDKDSLDAVESILPAGTLSGAPKIRACEIISELEGTRRGIYGGAIGYLDVCGNADTCISIRLAYLKNGTLCVQSGAGIVADSVEENEYQECLNKAKAVVDAISLAREGFDDLVDR